MGIDSGMEPYEQVGMLMNVGGENSGGDILKSLLTSGKMEKTEVEVNIIPESRTQPEEPVVFQIELGEPIKSEYLPTNENLIQDIPVTYLMANNSKLTPSMYVLSRDALPEATRYCTGAGVPQEPQKLIFVQEVDQSAGQTMFGVPETKVFAVKESQTKYHKMGCVDDKPEKNRKAKVLPSKKAVNRKKSSKLKTKPKSKPKTCGKGFVKKSKKSKPTEATQEEEIKNKETDRKHLFELTKLEDNVGQVAERLKIGCECSDSNCFDGLNADDVFKHRLNIADLTKAEHDMYLMGVIMASIHNLDETCRHKERIRIRSCYAYKGKKVCLTAFLYLQHVTLYQMKRLRSHLKNHGVSPRIHGNCGRKPANTFSLDIYRRASNFFQNYIEEHCVKSSPANFTLFSSNKITTNSISGARTGTTINARGKKTTSYHLPPECTKRIVHGEYKTFCESFKPSQKAMKYSTFTNFLKKQFPNVKFHKKEEKKPVRSEKEEKVEESEDKAENKQKEEQRVDKSIQVDKVCVPGEKEILINGHLVELCDQQPDFRVANQVVVGSQSYSVSQDARFYAIGSTV